MRFLRITVTIIFIVTTLLFSLFFIEEKMTTDKTVPKITIEEDLIDVSINATRKELLRGVTAYDEKDKDITDRIIVESVSGFIDEGICKVTYSVCDGDNNVAKATRKIRYNNYKAPEFTITQSLCYSIYEAINLSDIIKANDCIDGDITRSIIITSEDFVKSVAGVFEIEVSVTNSKGDTSIINIPLVVEDRSLIAPEIELDEYLIYLDVGEVTDFSKYLVEAKDNVGNLITDTVRIESTVDFSKAGIYTVHYFVTDSKGVQGHTILNVVIG